MPFAFHNTQTYAGLSSAIIQEFYPGMGFANNEVHDDPDAEDKEDHHDDHHFSSSSESKSSPASSSESSAERLKSLGVWPRFITRIIRQYPADYLEAWIDFVESCGDEIAKPGAYIFSALQGGEWPPLPTPSTVINPRPQESPVSPRKAPVVPNLPTVDTQEQERQERTQGRLHGDRLKAFRDGLSPSQIQQIVQAALTDPMVRSEWERSDQTFRRLLESGYIDSAYYASQGKRQ